jgi:hypothetical protein
VPFTIPAASACRSTRIAFRPPGGSARHVGESGCTLLRRDAESGPIALGLQSAAGVRVRLGPPTKTRSGEVRCTLHPRALGVGGPRAGCPGGCRLV